ncbi:uncharacterized protein LOC128309547 [Anopheles moucheti]|uniref:uncharacterized protein LOC128309547 n=1 Tax=Anopheles moucheti TaxID=186751 RepID=UPI0022F0E65A|nr:uncharacterized protein LOC128309547 [Anopheles moucheti]
MEQFSHDLTLALEETSRTNSSKVRWGVRRRTRSTGNLPCAPQPTEDSSSSPTDPPACNMVMNQADSPYLSGSNNIVQSDSDDRHSVAFTFKLRQTPLSGNFESDSLNENFSPARPNMRRKRKYKRMAVEYETTPSTPHIGVNPLFPVAGTVKKRVFKHSACPDSFRSTMLFCGKRKRSQRDRGGLDYDFCKQHSSSVPRQREFFGPKGSSYSEYKSRNRAASFSASMMKCERILPLNKTVVSKIERISADRDRERSALLEASRSTAAACSTPSAPVPVPTGGEFNFSIPLQQQQLLPVGNLPQPSVVMPLEGGVILPLLGSHGHDDRKTPHHPIVAVGTNNAVGVPLSQPSMGGIPPLALNTATNSLNALQQLVVPPVVSTVTAPLMEPLGTTQTGPLHQVESKPLLGHPFGERIVENCIKFQPSFSEIASLPPTVATVIEPMKAAVNAKTKTSYPKEKHRHRKSKYIRKKQMLMMAGPEGQGQLMDCGGQVNDFLSSSSLSSSDSEAVLANETDHEGDDELTDWPGNEAMITFASKHDFRKAYHGNRPPGAIGTSSAIGRPILPHVNQQTEHDLPDDDTLMSADELLISANVPSGMVGEIAMQPVSSSVAGIGLNTLDTNLAIPIGTDLSTMSSPFLVNNIAPGLPLANEIREIRAGCRRIREERPGFSIISSVNELLSRFLQDDQQRELTLHDVDKAEHDKLQDLCKLYSLNAQQLSENGSVVMLSKTSNTMQSVRIDQSNLPKRLGDFKRRCYGNAEALQFHDSATS